MVRLVCEIMTAEELWQANIKFLDSGIANRDNFILSNNGHLAVEGTGLWKELRYMEKRGFELSEDGMSLLKKR